MKKTLVILICLLAFCINNSYSQTVKGDITGEKSPYVGENYYTYTIKFSSPLVKSATVVVEADYNNVALFTDNTNTKFGMSNKSIYLAAGQSSFDFHVMWIKDAAGVNLIARNSTSSNNFFVEAKLQNINITTRKTEIVGPSSMIIGQTAEFTAEYARDIKDYQYKGHWQYDSNVFEVVEEKKLTDKFLIRLKAKQPVSTTNIGIEVEEIIFGIGRSWISRKGSKPLSVVFPYKVIAGSDIACPGNTIQFDLTGLDKTPGATVNWLPNNSFQLVSGQGTARATYRAMDVNANSRVSAEIIYQGLTATAASGNVWIGKPKTVYSQKEYNMEERQPLTIQAGEFTGKYTPNTCRWELLSGKCEFVDQSGMNLTLKSTAKAKENDVIRVRAYVSN